MLFLESELQIWRERKAHSPDNVLTGENQATISCLAIRINRQICSKNKVERIFFKGSLLEGRGRGYVFLAEMVAGREMGVGRGFGTVGRKRKVGEDPARVIPERAEEASSTLMVAGRKMEWRRARVWNFNYKGIEKKYANGLDMLFYRDGVVPLPFADDYYTRPP